MADCLQVLAVLQSRLLVAPIIGLNRAKGEVIKISARLKMAAHQSLARQSTRLAQLEASLIAIHPQRVLERGYSMTQSADGTVLSSIIGLKSGQDVILNFADGSAGAQIKKINSEGKK